MPTLHDHARTLRKQSTPAERALWQVLRAKQVNGVKWRRQYSDHARDAWLLTQGIHTLRFWNKEVLGNLAGVLERIAAHPFPRPPPTSGGGEESAHVP